MKVPAQRGCRDATVSLTPDAYSDALPTLQEEAARDLDKWLSGQE